MLNLVKLVSLGISVLLSLVYILIAISIDKKGKLKKDIDYVFPPIYFVLFLLGAFIQFSSFAGNSIQLQFIFGIASLVASFSYAYVIGKITDNGIEKQTKVVLKILYTPVKFILDLWKTIVSSLIKIWNAVVKFFKDLFKVIWDALVKIYKIFADSFKLIMKSITKAFKSFFDIFGYVGDMIKGIITMGGNIPDKVLPPAPPMPFSIKLTTGKYKNKKASSKKTSSKGKSSSSKGNTSSASNSATKMGGMATGMAKGMPGMPGMPKGMTPPGMPKGMMPPGMPKGAAPKGMPGLPPGMPPGVMPKGMPPGGVPKGFF